MALTTGFQLPFGIQPLNPVPTDSWSGPYEGANAAAAIAAANAAIPAGVRFKSLEVRLIINGTAAKYWYKDGITDGDLVEFATAGELPANATFSSSVSAPALSGSFYGSGAGLTDLYATVKGITASNNFALSSSHINSILTIDNGANNVIITVNTNFHNTSKIGTQIVLLQTGTGTITISSVAQSVDIISSYNRYKIIGQNSAAALIKVSTNSWFLGGDIAV